MRFLVVIPSFNEADRLGGFLPFFAEKLEECKIHSRVMVVDDGSMSSHSKAMQEICKRVKNSTHVIIEYLKLEQNRGKGGAVYAGWNCVKDESLLAFVDADGSVSPEEACRVLDLAMKVPNAAHFASRVKMRGRNIDRSTSRHRLGRIFATLVGTFIDSNIYDSQCGFKVVSAEQYRKIAPLLQEHRFAFDIELLAALNFVNCPVIEHPIDWKEVAGSKVSILSDSLQMAGAVLSISKRQRQWEQNAKI